MNKQCQNCKSSFEITKDDLHFYQKIQVPPPTFCPECRLIRRLSWRNMRHIYKRKCDLCGEDKIGVYSPDKPYRVYCSKCWWSDKWDAIEYGRDFDPSRPFLEQFNELLHEAPLTNRFGYEDRAVRSDYVNMFTDVKDCYLSFHVDFCERCFYGYHIDHCVDCINIGYTYGAELCYGSMSLQDCHRVFFSKDSELCHDSYFLRNCSGCSYCFGCSNLRNKQYHIFNVPYSKEEYFKKLESLGFDSGSHQSVERFKQQAAAHWLLYPSKYMHGIKNQNVSGDLVYNSKNTFVSFDVRDAEDVKYAINFIAGGGKDSMDWSQYGDKGELMYEVLMSGGDTYNDHFCWTAWRQTRNSEYCVLNISSADCFGCVALKHKQYCILNKQYSEEEYKALRAKIVSQMNLMPYKDNQGKEYRYGEFFPTEMSPFGYNEVTANEEQPLSEKEALQRGFKWADIQKHKGRYETTIKADELSDSIRATGEDITKEIISCAKCGNAYRIVPAELAFHKKLTLPLPRLCIDCRYMELRAMRNWYKLYHRQCQCAGAQSNNKAYANVSPRHQPHESGEHCPNVFETNFPSDQPDIVYCEQCYNAEVV